MRTRLLLTLSGFVILALAWLAAPPASDATDARQGTSVPEVYAEAIGQAMLRNGPGIEYFRVGEITTGTRYRVLARHTYVPWLQLDSPVGAAWVYEDLVTLTGNSALLPVVADFPPLSTVAPTRRPSRTPTATPGVTVDASNTASSTPAAPTATSTLSGPVVITLGEANIRFGPDLQYPVIVRVPAGASYRVLERHAIYPWLRIALDESPTGNGWIFRDVVEVAGDLSAVPVTSAQQFSYPTLTPTPQTVVVDGAPWEDATLAAGTLAATLGNAMHEFLLEQNFIPYSDRMASVFVLDLTSGDTFTLNGDVAYSGMSLTKIPILAAYFQRHSGPLSRDEAFLVADTMMCSENITTNQLLALIGEGDSQRGAQRVTAMLQSLGLRGTFIMREYLLDPDGPPPTGFGTLTTDADQDSARPDAYNQVVPEDLGWLLAGIYQCAQNETGLLVERFPNEFNAQECRQMLYAMDANTIGVFLEAGVPAGTRVIHKHGWVNDTHGDAGIVIGPNGAYVFVVTLYGRDWLEFELSTAAIGELSRMTWNTLNPANPVAAVAERTVPAECDPYSDPVMSALLSSDLPMISP